MHRYSIDNDSYIKILVGLTVVSALLNAMINIFIIPAIVKNDVLIQLVTLALSFFISFELIFVIFDKWLWKCWIFNKLTKCPNISGKWEGTINNPKFPEISTQVEIVQTWTKIIINLETETAKSKTKALTFYVEDSGNPELCRKSSGS